MKIVKFLVAASALFLLTTLLNSSFKIGDTALPALGNFLSPTHGFWTNVKDIDTFDDISLENEALNDDIEILLDHRLVPHIYASNLEDAMFAQGYILAKHRLFQMDLGARASAGRLSEVLGKDLLASDKMHRNIGMDLAAENAAEAWKKFPEHYPLIESYVAGINHYIRSLTPKDYPVEYKLIGFEPELWTPLKSAYFLKAMTLTLAGYEEDIEFTNALKLFGSEIFDQLYPDRTITESPIIPTIYSKVAPSESNINNDLSFSEPIKKYVSPKGIGSNNWAVSGSKTASGFPIFCNDPHLNLTLPSIWHELHIHTPEGSAYGVCLPGMPGIMIGFNEKIAWGETNVGHDLMDYFEIDWVDESREEYMVDGKKLKTEKKIQEYTLRGNVDVEKDTMLYTIFGPVPEDSYGNVDEKYAFRWLAHDAPDKPEYIAFIKGMMAKNYDEYKNATSNFIMPAQNFAYASNDGDIAIRINGLLPKKEYQDGKFVKAGTTAKNDWQEFIPRSENPQILNPERGYISSANQYSADESYPYYYHGRFEAFRGRSVNRLLDSVNNVTALDMMEMQASTYNLKAEESLPILLALIDESSRDEDFYQVLSEWDYKMDKDQKGPYFFDAWFYSFHQLLWDEVTALKDSIALPMPKHITTVQYLQKESDPFFDIKNTNMVESRSDLVNQAYIKAKDYYQKRSKSDSLVAYGAIHQIDIEHLIKLPAFSELNIATSGSGDVINAISTRMGPSWRMVVELGEFPKAYGIFPGGQSGHPGSNYYKNMIPKWTNDQYDTLIYPSDKKELKKVLYTINMKAE